MLNLLQFQKPGRYIGKEWNLNFKKPDSKQLRICLCFPESYEIGMSNLGFRIVYDILNNVEGVSCERCFMPGEDLEEYLLKTKTFLFSLETKTALREFDILGFSLNYELNFINFLKMLEMGGIRLKKDKRDKPLIVVGGLNNPEFLTDFVDVFFLGEFEESASSFTEALKKTKKISKKEKLYSLVDIPGVYIPEFYYQDNYSLKPKGKNISFPLKRVYTRDLDKSFYPRNWIVPYISLVFDRLQIELQRGCPNKCKFCQARCLYYPYRERKVQVVKERIKTLYKSTGYERISLLGLSIIDYSGFEELLEEIIPYFKEKRVGISIPSIRPTGKASKIIKMLSFAKKPGLTLALETGTNSLRKSIGKDIDIEDTKELIKIASHIGYRVFKFYFMFGLPQESDQDIIAIAQLLEDLAFLYKKEKGFYPQMNVSISCFIPKPFSEFQNEEMEDFQSFNRKKILFKKRLAKDKFIKISFSDYRKSFLEYLLARANRNIGPLIEEIAYNLMNKDFDYLNLDNWRNLSKKNNLDLDLFTKSNKTLPKHIKTFEESHSFCAL